jgi:hypothetical protein
LVHQISVYPPPAGQRPPSPVAATVMANIVGQGRHSCSQLQGSGFKGGSPRQADSAPATSREERPGGPPAAAFASPSPAAAACRAGSRPVLDGAGATMSSISRRLAYDSTPVGLGCGPAPAGTPAAAAAGPTGAAAARLVLARRYCSQGQLGPLAAAAGPSRSPAAAAASGSPVPAQAAQAGLGAGGEHKRWSDDGGRRPLLAAGDVAIQQVGGCCDCSVLYPVS